MKAWKLFDDVCADSLVAQDEPINTKVVNVVDGCLFTSSADGTVKMYRCVGPWSSVVT